MISIYRNFKRPEQTARDELNNPILQAYLQASIENRKCRCQRCGFTSPMYQLCINETCDDDDIKPVILCPICYMSERLEIAAEYNAGILVRLPEVSQWQINYMLHMIFKTLKSSKSTVDVSDVENLYLRLYSRNQDVAMAYHRAAPDVYVMSEALGLLSEDDYKNRGKIMNDLRFILKRDKLQEIFSFYQNNLYPKLDKK